MFSSKADVDRHVANSLKNINNQTKRNLKGFSFAKLYFLVGDFDQAAKYIKSYLSVKPTSAEGHKFLGKTLEKLNKQEAALHAYRSSFQLDSSQNDVLMKICEILSSENVELDKSGARYFCDVAKSADLNHSAVFSLKERILTSENNNNLKDIFELYSRELEMRPNDVKLHQRFITQLLQNNAYVEAYDHVLMVEGKNSTIFNTNYEWYLTVADVLIKYEKSLSNLKSMGPDGWLAFTHTMERLAALSFEDSIHHLKKKYIEILVRLFDFDQTLHKAIENLSNSDLDKQYLYEFTNHYTAQLAFHLATLLLKKCREDSSLIDTLSISAAVLFSYAYHTPPVDTESLSYLLTYLSDNRRESLKQWQRLSAYRCSQAGHILKGISNSIKTKFVVSENYYNDINWREQIYKLLFTSREHQNKFTTSLFLTSNQGFANFMCRSPPDSEDLLKYDRESQFVYPDSMHHHVWLASKMKLSTYRFLVLPNLAFTSKNLRNCAPETLCNADMDAFIYLSTLCAKKRIYGDNMRNFNVLPASLTSDLTTNNQVKFFTSIYRMALNECRGEMRVIMVRVIEFVRCIDSNGFHVRLLIDLANLFVERVKESTKPHELEENESRAIHYWTVAILLLETLKNNQPIKYKSNNFFDYSAEELTKDEILQHLETGKLFLAYQDMKKKDYEKALKLFDGLRDPFASFYSAQIYTRLAEVNAHKENESRILLMKAKGCLYLTLDRLREPGADPKHVLNEQLGDEIEKIENLLAVKNMNNGKGDSAEFLETSRNKDETFIEHFLTPNVSAISNGGDYSLNLGRSMQSEAKPSPERLDAQLRRLTLNKNTAIDHLVEQNKYMINSHNSLVNELKDFKTSFGKLTTAIDGLNNIKQSVDEIREIRQSIDDVKTIVDELENFKLVTDMVYEMKKEIAEIKKDLANKHNQMSDEDIYGLTNDYANYTPNNQNPYTNIQSAPPPSLYGPGPPALYPGVYPPLPYGYGGLPGFPPPGTLPFNTEHQQLASDYRSMTLSVNALPHAYPAVTSLATHLPAINPSSQPPPPSLQPPTALTTTTSSTFSGLFSNAPKPITTTGSISSITSTPITTTTPVNVVITLSDPLPVVTSKTQTSQAVLSVIIPPQHLKSANKINQPHNYQIPLPTGAVTTVTSTPPTIFGKNVLNESKDKAKEDNVPKTNLGGFVFSSTPTFKPKVEEKDLKITPIATEKKPGEMSPFSALNLTAKTPTTSLFGGVAALPQPSATLTPPTSRSTNNANNTSDTQHEVDDFVPNVEFKPVIPLPELVDIVTGEENAEILFECRAKLLRFACESDTKEWKERGVGIIKILKDPTIVRLVMRRDQIHKICLNHQLLKQQEFQFMPKNTKALMWCAKDFSDGVITNETFAIRFKTEEQANEFLKTINDAQAILDDNNSIVNKKDPEKKVEEPVKDTKSDWGNLFKPKQGTWNCKSCYAQNDQNKIICACCETPKDGVTGSVTITPIKKTESISLDTGGLKFNFGIPAKDVTPKPATASTFTFGATPTTPKDQPAKEDVTKSVIEKFVFGSPQKHNFEFKSPKAKNEENSDGSFLEEECDNIYFKPVVPLPDKVEVKTGEENEEVLYTHKAKLFRFTDGEWKERGVGDVKILKDKATGKLRILMRRDQIFKICLNHTLNANINYMSKDEKTWLFNAPDYSEGEIRNDCFCIKFKNSEIAQEFKEAIDKAVNSGETSSSTTTIPIVEKDNTDDDNDVQVVSETQVTAEEEKEAIRLGLPAKFMAYRQLPDCACDQCKKDDVYLKDLLKNDNKKKEVESTLGLRALLEKKPIIPLDTVKPIITTTPQTTPTPATTSQSIFRSSQFTFSTTWTFATPTTSLTNTQAVSSENSATKPFNFTSSFKANFGINTPVTTTTPASPISFTTSIFSTPSVQTTTASNGNSIFGGTTSDASTKSNDIFSTPSKPVGTDLFGTTNLFGGSAAGGGFTNNGTSLFGLGASNTGTIFGGNSILNKDKKDVKPDVELKETDKPVLDARDGLSFASLAAAKKTDDVPTFLKSDTTPSTIGSFSFLNAGAPIFGGAKKTTTPDTANENKTDDADETKQTDQTEEEYDPHYEPVIPLPDTIVVSTGEEEETAVFDERAQLYRYDEKTKEWKERGVGQMKILHHPIKNTYRFLLRREQIFKIALNQLITKDLELQPMLTSDKAWIWAGFNYTDDQNVYEKLAIRFKTCALAQQFKKIVDETVEKVKELKKTDEVVERRASGNSDSYVDDEEDGVDDEYDDEDDYEDGRQTVLMKPCTLYEQIDKEWHEIASGDIQIYYDPIIDGEKVSMTTHEGEIVSDTLIGINTVMKVEDMSCIWGAIERLDERGVSKTFKAVFATETDAKEFHYIYLGGLHYAQECDIVDA